MIPSPVPNGPDDTPRRARDKRPRIAFLGSRGIPARYGGFETFVEEVSKRLVESGVEVTVYCEGNEGPDEVEGIDLRYVAANAPGPLRTLWFDLCCLWQARRGYDAVYMLGYASALFCILPRLFGTEVWINMDGLEWKRSKWGFLARTWLKWMEGVAFRTANRLIFDNAALHDIIRARRTRPINASVIEYGAPTLRSAPNASVLEKFDVIENEYYLVVCRFEPENHVLEIAQAHAAAGIERPLVIVANTDLGTAYVKRCEALASDRIRFVGTVYDQEILLALRSHCRAAIHGHSVGGTNPSLLEAMVCGKPILAHSNPFNRETLGESGSYWDVEWLSTRWEKFDSTNFEFVAARGLAARERALTHFSWDRIAKAYLDLLPAIEAHREIEHKEAA